MAISWDTTSIAATHQRNTLAQRRSSRMLNGGGGNHHVYARGGQIFLEEAGYNLSVVRYRHRYMDGWMDGRMDGWMGNRPYVPLCVGLKPDRFGGQLF